MKTQVIKYIVDVDHKRGVGSFNKLGAAGSGAAMSIGAAFAKAGPYVAVAATAAAALGVAIKKSVDAYKVFETELANVSTLVDTNVVDMGKLKDQLLGLDSVLGSTTENTKALYQAISAGVDADAAVGFVGEAAKAAIAGLTDTFTAVDAGTTILNAFGIEAAEVVDVYDKMFVAVRGGKTTFEELSASIGKVAPLASTAGVGVDELLAGIAALTKQGIGTSEAVTGLKAALSNIIKPMSAALDTAADLKIEFNAAALESQGLAGFLNSVAVATGGNVETMGKLFGSTEALNSILALTSKTGAKDLNEMLKQMANSAGETSTAFKKQANTINVQMAGLSAAVEKVWIRLGEAASEPLIEILKNLTLLIEKFSESELALGIVTGAMGKFFGIIRDITNIVVLFVSGIETIIDMFKSFISAINESSPFITELFNLYMKLGEALNKLTYFGGLTTDRFSVLLEVFKEVYDFIKDMMGPLGGVIGLWNKFADVIGNVASKIKTFTSEQFEVVFSFLGKGSTIAPLGEKIDEMTGKLSNMTDGASTKENAVKFDFQGTGGDSLTNALNNVDRGFNNMFDDLIDGTLNVQDSFSEMLKSIVTGIAKMLASQAITGFLGMIGGSFFGGGGMTAFADGGQVRHNKPIVVGERGPEIFMPRGPGSVVPNHQLGGGGGSISVVNNINVGSGSTGDAEGDRRLANDIARSIDEKIKMQIAQQMRPGGLLNQTQRLGAYS